jgi:hypothetical protein
LAENRIHKGFGGQSSENSHGKGFQEINFLRKPEQESFILVKMPSDSGLQPFSKFSFSSKIILLQSKTFYICCS